MSAGKGRKKGGERRGTLPAQAAFSNWLKCHHFKNRMILLLRWTAIQETGTLSRKLTRADSTTILSCRQWHLKCKNVLSEPIWLRQYAFLGTGCWLLCLITCTLRKLLAVGPSAEILRFYTAPAQVKPQPGHNGRYSFSKRFLSDSRIQPGGLEENRSNLGFTPTPIGNLLFAVTSHKVLTGTICPKTDSRLRHIILKTLSWLRFAEVNSCFYNFIKQEEEKKISPVLWWQKINKRSKRKLTPNCFQQHRTRAEIYSGDHKHHFYKKAQEIIFFKCYLLH